MKLIFNLDETLCSACGACAIACMDQNDIDVEHQEKPFRMVYQYEDSNQTEPKKALVSFSISCMHCIDAPCISACPKKVLYKDNESGLTLFDSENCIGCRACFRACPYDAPSYDANGKMEKCDGCIERVKAGLDPACVHTCPTGALTCSISEDCAVSYNSLAALYKKWSCLDTSRQKK